MKKHLLITASLLFASLATAETVKDREGAVRGDKAALENDPRWNYNDIDAGFRLAKTTGKPLLVVLRCLPCMSCAGMDAGVLHDAALATLLDQFVCVRVINANALDLTRFQFDYDLSLTAIVFHADGTVYGRFASWSHQKDPLNKSVTGFQKTLQAALELHKRYPANKASLAGKQPVATPYRTPVEFPTLAAKYGSKLDWDGKVVQSCVHCHMVGDAFRAHHRSQNKPMPLELIYPHPMPDVLGLTLAADEIAKVESVTAESIAAKAGVQVGDEFTAMEGQPLISTADFSHVLHRASPAGSVKATIQRGGKPQELTLLLPAGWRTHSDISKRAGTWPMRAMAFGGMHMIDLENAEREKQGLTTDQLALHIDHVGQYGPHAAAKKAGFQKGDILIQVGDIQNRMTESQIIGYLLASHQPGEKLPSVVLRGGKKVTLDMPQQ
ncbi:MAG: PDZ domain-containing protein [Verrucomicrobiaceae bacterium]|nr:PDZ domain-containing protein [Verrucomicrobiaceae bacterium]